MSDKRAWLKSGEYLPPFLRDFHDQKDVFKAIDDVVQRRDDPSKDIGWIPAQIYTVDVFLWVMARHGYTLQRSRAKVDFDDLERFIEDSKEQQQAIFAGLQP